MKRVITILCFFVIMLGFSVWEGVGATKFYSRTVELLTELEESFDANSENINTEDNVAILDELNRHWNNGLKFILMLGNHTLLRNAEEKLTALDGYTRLNQYADAKVSLMQSKRYVSDLMRDVYPSLTNIL